ncbi:MAG: putative sulfate exporter family transporter [Betaproteobacteria bacterium]
MKTKLPGLTCAAIVAIAALFLSEHYGASAMLFALLLGMALNFLSQEGKCVAGIQFAASSILRFGVALLGLRITYHEIAALGLNTVLMIVAAVVLTIVFGWIFVRFTSAMSTGARFGILTGGAVAICGASAALAIAAVLPRGPHHERDTTFTVIGVTALSTIAMVMYPIICSALGFNPHQAGIFLGGTIHDVAQVVGAGYSMGKETGDTATIVKLLRVAMLLPVILVLSLTYRRQAAGKAKRPPILPWFAVAFGVLVAVNSLIDIPKPALNFAGELSRFALVVAISAIGMRTSLKELTVLGLRPVLLMVAETVFLAGIIIGMMKLLTA